MPTATALIDAEAPDDDTRERWQDDADIHTHFERLATIMSLTIGDTITIVTSNAITSLTATVTDTPANPTTGNATFAFDVDSITGTKHKAEEIIIAIDREGASGSLHEWKDVPYLTALPTDHQLPSYGEVTRIEN